MITKDLKSADRLINRTINTTLEMWSQDSNGQCYLIRHCENEADENDVIKIQPTYSEVFYGIGDYIRIAEACGCDYYVSVEENKAGKMTPTIRIY